MKKLGLWTLICSSVSYVSSQSSEFNGHTGYSLILREAQELRSTHMDSPPEVNLRPSPIWRTRTGTKFKGGVQGWSSGTGSRRVAHLAIYISFWSCR